MVFWPTGRNKPQVVPNNTGASPVEIKIPTPPLLFQETFNQQTEVITVGNVRVLKPALLLNAKCGAISGKSNESKRITDLQDILFLLHYCAQNPMYLLKAVEVPKATKDFVQGFILLFGGQDRWVGAG